MIRPLLLLCCILLAATGRFAAGQLHDAPVEARAPFSPTVFEGSDDRTHLAYELHLTNFYGSTGTLRLRRLSVYVRSPDQPLATYTGNSLAQLLSSAPEQTPPFSEIAIAGGRRTVLFLWLTLADRNDLPRTLHHRMELLDDKDRLHTVEGVPVPVTEEKVPTLGPPLRQHLWMVNEGPGNARSHHWGSIVAVNGAATIPQRFAIDFVGLTPAGHAVVLPAEKLHQTTNADWTGFDAEVLAVADGTVRDYRDGVADNVPLTPQEEPQDLTARGLYGNFIVLEIAPGVFVHYAHLRKGSLPGTIRTGVQVKRGEVLAHVGDSGSTGAPHLHLHLSNSPLFEESEGLPFTFAAFDRVGQTDEGAILNAASKLQLRPAPKQHELPLHGDVVAFPLP